MMRNSGLASLLLTVAAFNVSADDATTLLRLEGTATPQQYPLSTYNRIYFGETGMTLASATNDAIQQIKWDYTSYDVIKLVGQQASIDELEVNEVSLTVNGRTAKLTADSPECFTLRIYNTTGMQMSATRFNAEGIVEIANLAPGIYFATATDGLRQFTTKFIMR